MDISKALAEFDEKFPEIGYPRGTRNDRMKEFISNALLQMKKDTENELREKIAGKLTVYYRSKFSADCSRNESEEEKNTEMVALQDVLTLLSLNEQPDLPVKNV